MTTNLYSQFVDVDQETDSFLKRSFLQHMSVYNQCLGLLRDDPEISFKNVKKYADNYVTTQQLTYVNKEALANELFYQFKKFKRNIRVQKLVTDIHYFTLIGKGNKFGKSVFQHGSKQIALTDIPGEIRLPEPLPYLDREESYYLNISYSNREDKFKLTLFKA